MEEQFVYLIDGKEVSLDEYWEHRKQYWASMGWLRSKEEISKDAMDFGKYVNHIKSLMCEAVYNLASYVQSTSDEELEPQTFEVEDRELDLVAINKNEVIHINAVDKIF